MIYLDTHAVIWLSLGELDKFSPDILDKINSAEQLYISPMVELEINFLKEIGRINKKPKDIIKHLHSSIGLLVHDLGLDVAISKALEVSWTRDPFDRLITAQAALTKSGLITKDNNIRRHYKYALWAD